MVTVIFWAAARDAATVARTSVEPGPLVGVLADLVERHPGLKPLMSRSRIVVNAEFADPQTATVSEGDTVEIMPPYAGG